MNYKNFMRKKLSRPSSVLLLILATGGASSSYAVDHSMHGGGSSGGASAGGHCVKAHFTEFTPVHLATVAPHSAFSFYAYNIEKPEQIEVTIKSQPVAITTENRGNFYRIVGNLPADLKDTPARISIKYTAKMVKCNADDGWLVTITP
jgi:hypothetical protein